MKYIDKRTNEQKTAYSIVEKNDKVYVKYSENGKEYAFNPNNIEIIPDTPTPNTTISDFPHRIYYFDRECHKCKKLTTIYTYIVFDDGTNEDVTFPWDKERLLEYQDLECHLLAPEIEFYGLKTIGRDKKLDKILLEKFPDKIQKKYSGVLKKTCPMNICQHCGAKQGDFYVYEMVNQKIKKSEQIYFLTDEHNASF